MYKLKIAVLFGGCSEEHDVSVKSAMEVAANINKEKYQLFYIGITKSGAWKLCDKPCRDWENYAGSPAALPDEVREQIQETAKKIYRVLGCRGLARIDLFLREDGSIVLNEVNTMPGFTSYSRYPRMMTAAGFTLSEILDRLIGLSLRR